jgi:hypothetical protein
MDSERVDQSPADRYAPRPTPAVRGDAEVVLITRTVTQNQGNQALSVALRDLLETELTEAFRAVLG